MPLASDPNSLERFFAFGEKAVRRYQVSQDGQLTIDCKKRSNNGGEKGFKLIAHGCFENPFCVTPAQLDNYLLRRQLQMVPNRIREPFCYLEESVLEILGRTGHGRVSLEFEKDKKGNTVLICLVTLSHRHIILAES